MDLLTLIATCAPMVAPTTMKAIVLAESRGHPYAIYDGATDRSFFPETNEEAVITARQLVARGDRIDAGLAQINSDNWSRLGLDVERVFDPCRNLAAGERILLSGYNADPHTVDAALSRYNTGHETRGIRNGYVGRVKDQMHVPQPRRSYEVAGGFSGAAEEGRGGEVRSAIDAHLDRAGEGVQGAGAASAKAPGPKVPPWRFEPAVDGFSGGG